MFIETKKILDFKIYQNKQNFKMDLLSPLVRKSAFEK